MTSLHLQITLLTEAIFSSSSATVGTPECLDHIPGSNLLGACAATSYRALDRETSFALFHSGQVRFGNAHPVLVEGTASWPMPLSFHAVKGASDKTTWYNLAVAKRADVQYEQRRRGWLVGNDRTSLLDRRVTMRTAVDGTGRAREGLLYGFESLPAGQRFLARIDADKPALLDTVRTALLQGPVRLGRSRTAEFGLARVQEVPSPTTPVFSPHDKRILLYCVSDLCLRDVATGQPRLLPCASDFGLEGHLDLSRTFLRTRRYSPFNAKRRRPDLERQVIQAGSVLVFHVDTVSDERLQQLSRGVGEYLQDGLGQILVNPAFLATDQVQVQEAGRPQVPGELTPPDNDELFLWIQARHAERTRQEDAWKRASAWMEKVKHYHLPNAQWGSLRDLARQAAGRSDGAAWLRSGFVELSSKGVAALPDKWGARLGRDSLKLSEVVAGLLSSKDVPEAHIPLTCEIFAARMARPKEVGND